jgi:hypothetical protein
MLPIAPWYAAIAGAHLDVSCEPPVRQVARRALPVRLVGYGLIRLGRTLSRRRSHASRLAHLSLAR